MWLASPNEDNYNRYAEELFELASEQLLIIGTVGFAPLPVIVSNQVGDFPRDVRWIGDDTRFLRDAKPDTWFRGSRPPHFGPRGRRCQRRFPGPPV